MIATYSLADERWTVYGFPKFVNEYTALPFRQITGYWLTKEEALQRAEAAEAVRRGVR